MQTDLEGALNPESRLQQFMSTFILPFKTHHHNVALDRLLAAVGGWSRVGTRVPWPYRSEDAGHVAALRRAALAAVPELMVF